MNKPNPRTKRRARGNNGNIVITRKGRAILRAIERGIYKFAIAAGRPQNVYVNGERK